jgi:hypothetical protein
MMQVGEPVGLLVKDVLVAEGGQTSSSHYDRVEVGTDARGVLRIAVITV